MLATSITRRNGRSAHPISEGRDVAAGCASHPRGQLCTASISIMILSDDVDVGAGLGHGDNERKGPRHKEKTRAS